MSTAGTGTQGSTSAIAAALIADAREFLRDGFLPKIVRFTEPLDDASIWWRPNPESNSIGNLMLHLVGSTRMWVIGIAGNHPVTRDRDAEFSERGPIAKTVLLDRLRAALEEVDGALAGLDVSTLLERRQSSRGEVTVLQAVEHAVEHFSMHTGQIILLAKMRGATIRTE